MSKEIQFLLYSLPDEEGKVQVVIKDETLWCTQKAMAQLFGVGVPAISKHLKNIFEEGELSKNVVVSKMEITTQHGAMEGKTQSKEVEFPSTLGGRNYITHKKYPYNEKSHHSLRPADSSGSMWPKRQQPEDY